MTTTPSAGPVDEARLGRLIEDGNEEWISLLLAGTPPEQLSYLMPGIRQRRRQNRGRWGYGPQRQRSTLWLAGAVCQAGPAAVAQWIAARDLDTDGASAVALLRVLRDRDPRWQREVARRIAERLSGRRASCPAWQVAYGLTVFCDAPAPVADGFVRGWVAESGRPADKDIRFLLARQAWGAVPAGPPVADRLRADPFLDRMVPRLFEVDGLGAALRASNGGKAARPGDGLAAALARLANEGRLERGTLIDLCLARLARAEQPIHQRGFLDLYVATTPTVEERAARVPAYMSLLTDGTSTAARLAQRELRQADESGQVDSDPLLEVSGAVLRRPEAKLVAGQLTWLDGHARRHPDRAGQVSVVAAVALRQGSAALQGKAAAVIARHAGSADGAALDEIRFAVRGLGTGVRALVLPHLGVADAMPPEPADTAPSLPPYRPAPMLPPLDSLAAVAEEFDAALNTGGVDVDGPHLERLLAALVAHAWADRQALIGALLPVQERTGPSPVSDWPLLRTEIRALLAAGARAYAHDPRQRIMGATDYYAPDRVLIGRLREAAAFLHNFPTHSVPCLLAVPTEGNGLIDPAVLVERVRGCEEARCMPWPCDFEQALLRLPATAEPDVIAAARLLTSREGLVLADRLAASADAVPAGPVGPRQGDQASPKRRRAYGRGLFGAGARNSRRPAPNAFNQLTSMLNDVPPPSPTRRLWFHDLIAQWPAVVPARPDLIAAHALPAVISQREYGHPGTSALLPKLAESAGPFGRAAHVTLAHALSARTAEARAAAVTALTTLAARELLDPAELGDQLGTLMIQQPVSRRRVHACLRHAAHSGAYRQVWAILAAALPRICRAYDLRDTGDLLALATECADCVGARGSFPELDALAHRSGRVRSVVEARRLRRTLTG